MRNINDKIGNVMYVNIFEFFLDIETKTPFQIRKKVMPIIREAVFCVAIPMKAQLKNDANEKD